ncbi:MAG: multicopper oxidase domain-containing protein [Candidatus Acidiferrum sp.]
MNQMNTHKPISMARLLLAPMMALFLAVAAHATTPGITGGTSTPVFNLTAQTAFLNQPDGNSVYAWGYGCNGAPSGFLPNAIFAFAPACPTMQVPGPTLIVNEGDTVTVNLLNGLPTPAGNTSILFPDFQLTSSCAAQTAAQQGLLTCEAVPGGTVSYTFLASTPGTHAYYSGTQGDLQVEMGLFGAIIVLPATVPANCDAGLAAQNFRAQAFWGEQDFRLSHAAYDHSKTCYDREYLFQWSEIDPTIHRLTLAQVTAKNGCTAGAPGCSLEVPTEPYHPSYFLINGRSMPDLMDPNYAAEYPHQPYNGNPHMHPGEQVLIRTIGQGRWQHPFHEHANHVRILARDGNLILSATDPNGLAGLLMFNTDTTPGQAFDGIFYWSGRGLNWDPYGHTAHSFTGDTLAEPGCTADANGYNTGFAASDVNFTGAPVVAVTHAVNYYEWCQDHNKPVEAAPFGDVTAGGPATLPNPNIFTNGPWYGGTPYLGPDATLRASTTLRPTAGAGSSNGCVTGTTVITAPTGTNPSPNCSPLQPANVQANPANERGFAFMWHSHNEREITTNNVFPGGMLMMMLVDSREFLIDESL